MIAATNHEHQLDPATLRRFVFKLRLAPIGRDRAARASERFFRITAPTGLAAIDGLTPGDFAVVARQLRFAPTRGGADLVDRLRREAAPAPRRRPSKSLSTR